MTKGKLEIMLREAGAIARDRDFFLFGSQSLHAVRPHYPKGFPKSLEADLYPRHHPQAWGLLRQQMGRDSKFFRKHGVYLDCVDPALAMIPDGWLERLIPFCTPRTGGVTAWCLEPHDLFVSKLAAWREKDQQFLRAMLKHKLAKPLIVLNRIEDLPVSAARREELKQLVEELVGETRANRAKSRRKK